MRLRDSIYLYPTNTNTPSPNTQIKAFPLLPLEAVLALDPEAAPTNVLNCLIIIILFLI